MQTRLDHYNLSYRVGNFLLVAARAKIIILKVLANNGLRLLAPEVAALSVYGLTVHSFALAPEKRRASWQKLAAFELFPIDTL